MESLLDLRDRLMPRIPNAETKAEAVAPITPTAQPEQVLREAAFAVEAPNKVMLAMPIHTGPKVDEFVVRLSGRLVEAEQANANGAFWTYGDLEFGLPSVAAGPLNWLHQERKVVGALTKASLTPREQAGIGRPYVQADSAMWRWLYPTETAEVEQAAQAGQLWYSMECVAQSVQCVGPNGCGTVVEYNDREKQCAHMRERAAHRRLINPVFLGAAVIVPPTQPGWSNANIELVRQAAALAEKDHITMPGLSTIQAENMLAQIISYAKQ